ncbi:MAG: hypothetical protein M1826_003488 [Phylliscum demangeonii]|nr:MAG: hypothetical protein M1826_003488 [Phylliscum demangeonii]
MFYDLNILWTPDHVQLQRTFAFLDELGYNVVALSHIVAGKVPVEIVRFLSKHERLRSATKLTAYKKDPFTTPLPFPTPAKLRILRRCTVVISDPSQNHRLPALAAHYDILALRPTTERSLQQACQNVDINLISLDLTVRHPFHFKQSILRAAIKRGVRFEICYAPAIVSSDAMARRNLISNATQLIRATGGRGIVISSEAKTALGLRAPIDLVNCAAVWGLGSDQGRRAVDQEARLLVLTADMRKTSWRGVIDVIDGGDAAPKKPKPMPGKEKLLHHESAKRKGEAPISKRQAKKARLEAAQRVSTERDNLVANGPTAVVTAVLVVGAKVLEGPANDETVSAGEALEADGAGWKLDFATEGLTGVVAEGGAGPGVDCIVAVALAEPSWAEAVTVSTSALVDVAVGLSGVGLPSEDVTTAGASKVIDAERSVVELPICKAGRVAFTG